MQNGLHRESTSTRTTTVPLAGSSSLASTKLSGQLECTISMLETRGFDGSFLFDPCARKSMQNGLHRESTSTRATTVPLAGSSSLASTKLSGQLECTISMLETRGFDGEFLFDPCARKNLCKMAFIEKVQARALLQYRSRAVQVWQVPNFQDS